MNIGYYEDFDSLNKIIFQYFQSQFYFFTVKSTNKQTQGYCKRCVKKDKVESNDDNIHKYK